MPPESGVAHRGQIDEGEQFGQPLADRAGAHPEERGDELGVLGDRQIRVKHELLRGGADPLAVGGANGGGRAREHAQLAGLGAQQAARQADGIACCTAI